MLYFEPLKSGTFFIIVSIMRHVSDLFKLLTLKVHSVSDVESERECLFLFLLLVFLFFNKCSMVT